MKNPKVLIIEDDQTVSGLIRQQLETEGLSVDAVFDGREGIRLALQNSYDLILLDVMLPHVDGFEVLNQLRAVKQTPVLMLTAKGGEQDRICGFKSGADDYLIKPFSMAELTLRIEAILRRTRVSNKSLASVACGRISLDPISGEALVNGKVAALTPLEFDLLRALMEQTGQVVGKAELYQSVLCREFSRYDRTLDMHISKIRKKISATGMPMNTIRTVRGQGYSFESV